MSPGLASKFDVRWSVSFPCTASAGDRCFDFKTWAPMRGSAFPRRSLREGATPPRRSRMAPKCETVTHLAALRHDDQHRVWSLLNRRYWHACAEAPPCPFRINASVEPASYAWKHWADCVVQAGSVCFAKRCARDSSGAPCSTIAANRLGGTPPHRGYLIRFHWPFRLSLRLRARCPSLETLLSGYGVAAQ